MVNISTYNPAVGAPSVVNTKAFKIYFYINGFEQSICFHWIVRVLHVKGFSLDPNLLMDAGDLKAKG